jgi:hypothetical protein
MHLHLEVTLLVVWEMLQALSTMLDREALVCLVLVSLSPNSNLRNLHFHACQMRLLAIYVFNGN